MLFFITTPNPHVFRLSCFSVLTPPPPLIFMSYPFLLGFCCILVKSQLATVSRSLAALTMASGIMLNTAPRLLSPSTGISDALWSTQERDGGLSMKMSLQLHKRVSQTPSLSALPPLASPFPTFKKFLFDSLLKCSFISCSSFIMHAHFEFAWIHFPDASAAILTYNDVYCTVLSIVLPWDEKNNNGLFFVIWGYFSISPLTIRSYCRGTHMCCRLSCFCCPCAAAGEGRAFWCGWYCIRNWLADAQ